MPSNNNRRGAEAGRRKRPLVFSAQAIRLTERIGEDPQDLYTVWDVWCGLHSGFPECCIAYYVKVWQRLSFARWEHEDLDEQDNLVEITNLELVELVDVVGDRYDRMLESLGLVSRVGNRVVGPGYIVCPACALSGNIVKVKRCTCRKGKTPPAFPTERNGTKA